MMLIDSHCHLNMPDLAVRLPQILENMALADIGQAIAISVDRTSAAEVLVLAEQHTNLFASVGVHPEYQNSAEMSVDELVAAARHPKVVGIGETGLDYHWCSGDLAWQHQRFSTHIQASNQTGLPLIIHTREAASDTLRLLRENQAQQGVIHCFTEDTAFAKAILDLGFYISFSGIVTFKNARQIQEACRYVPLDRILVETDAPYLAPVPKRGKQNEPAYVRYTAEFVAQLRGDSITSIEEATTANTYRLFNKIPPVCN
ncbi:MULTISPECIES: TatD family hydrolase [unclassified Snodgrassella]|uniref:TatD family hydrolase n=1 Tax=unclassified Snodgrassella TaxID=2625236 RepID=UPI00055F7E0D|nr:TatD family hydrolase [Snodgrassella alvi]MBI0067968.1 TatD family hydrolase [Snodgrassella sp. M0110]MBI0076967.1 TatD family hydrolase [Snodgrassella sp. M0118]MBI0079268.1 TatD family hydrolase [Snodgrassella sp. M0112]